MDNFFYAVGFNNKFQIIFLQLYLLFSNKNAYFYNTVLFFSKGCINNWFIKKRKIVFKNDGIGQIKGLVYEVNKEALELVELFYNKYCADSYLKRYLEKALMTNKYAPYLKKKLCNDIYEVLAGLYLVKEFSQDKRIVLIDSPLNRFIVDEFFKKNRVNFDIRWLNFDLLFCLGPFAYGFYILRRILFAGITWKQQKEIKLYREAVWGLYRPIIKDDFLVDNINFRKDDIIFYSRYNEEARNNASQQLKGVGYTVVDFNKCKLNIRNGLGLFIKIFLIQPLQLFLVLYFNKQPYLTEHMLKFYIECLPHFLFLTNYNAKCHISTVDCGEIAETIIINRLGCKNILYHWSDMTQLKNVQHAFTAHNIYYAWGQLHYDFQKEYYFSDKVQIVGCTYLSPYFDYLKQHKKKQIEGIRKKVLICDNAVHNGSPLSEDFYLEFLDVVIEMLKTIENVEFIFKSKKSMKTAISNYFSTEELRKKYLKKINYLCQDARFVYYDYFWQIEPLIALSDLVVTMGLTSPSTIALILRKEAVYYDTTGNNMHPLTEYMNQVVFDDKDLLIDQIRCILDGKKSVFDYIDPELLNRYEPFRDSKALERLINAIYKETVS